ncbi:PfkB family carbohydrate kinase [uncultured Roseobacter sp.]|uniref:PfkB family carbohydrate kinase n=1 Tax=uncultured Roseobacter sp. TaxID=114847 RepID=UPI0026158F34|nr:PfkB family carbohydrate kinase [uncultured Roseobacter sp.]
MSSFAVVGGLYGERCIHPNVDELYGSGGRAAVAIARAGHNVDWHYYCPTSLSAEAEQIVAWPRLTHKPYFSTQQITFEYHHPLSRPVFYPGEIDAAPSIEVKAAQVLRFGLMEGDAVIDAETCVYDPQSTNDPRPFHENGSRAGVLALVLNSAEVLKYASATDEASAIAHLRQSHPGSIVLVKAGAEGCRVYEDGILSGTVPPYWSERVYKIGTGDVFSAAFARNWMLEGQTCLEAADIASRCVARYAESRTPTVSLEEAGTDRKPIVQTRDGLVYLAGPIFTMSEIWMIDQVTEALEGLGVPVFSPYRDVGFGTAEKVVSRDIAGLERATAVFACIDGTDPGTMFEIGYAVKKGIPVICLSQNPKQSDLTMMLGSANCHIHDDLSTAVYHTAWWART